MESLHVALPPTSTTPRRSPQTHLLAPVPGHGGVPFLEGVTNNLTCRDARVTVCVHECMYRRMSACVRANVCTCVWCIVCTRDWCGHIWYVSCVCTYVYGRMSVCVRANVHVHVSSVCTCVHIECVSYVYVFTCLVCVVIVYVCVSRIRCVVYVCPRVWCVVCVHVSRVTCVRVCVRTYV